MSAADCVASRASAIFNRVRDKITRRANQFRIPEIVSSPKIENISVYRKLNQGYIFAHPVLVRRASAVVTDVGRVAMDAGLRWTMAQAGVRQNRVVLAPVAGVKLSDSQKLAGSDGVNQELVSGESTA